MSRKRGWSVANVVKGMEAWLASPPCHAAKLAIPRVIEKDADLSTPLKVADAYSSLELLGLYEGVQGCLLVTRGDPAGWPHLRASALASAWFLALRAGLWYRGVRSGFSGFTVQQAAGLALALAIAVREDEAAHWLGGVLVEGMKGPAPFADWRMNPFEPFITKLYARWRGEHLDVARPGVHPLGVYQAVFDRWDGDAALQAVCDYHLERAVDHGRGAPEFIHAPICLFPAEVIALRRVRADLGLTTPSIKHPLLDGNPLAEVPAPLPPMTLPYHLRLREKATAYITALRDGTLP